MFKIIRLTLLCAVLVVVTGCAHNIVITPAAVDRPKVETANKSVGFFIAAADKAKEVVTPGGGGDKVSYFPYRDLESSLFGTLMRVYSKIEVLPNLESAAGKSLNHIIVPGIETDSSSESAFTWPPTDFKVVFNVKAQDAAGIVLWTENVTGKGKAEFSEFKTDFALSAKRAAQDVLDKLEAALRKREGLK
jgi:hypothetical protein